MISCRCWKEELLVVDVLVKNKSGIIPDHYVANIISIITKELLIEGKIVLVLTDELDEKSLGECIPKNLMEYAGRESFFREYSNVKWDVGIILYPKGFKYFLDYPAFFTYLLGHELGHAYVCLKDQHLHLFYCLIEEVIIEASNEKVKRWDQLPHEVLFDQYGLFIAELLYSREEINRQMEMIVKISDYGDKERLNKLLSLSASCDFSKLRSDLIQFCLPFKENLIRLWKEDAKKATLENELAIAQLVTNFELLFEY